MRETPSVHKGHSPRLKVVQKTILGGKKKYKIPFVKLGLLVGAIFAAFTIIDQELDINEKTVQLKQAETKLHEKNLLNEEMEWMVQHSDSKTNYERIARSELGLVRPDERVFIFISGD